MNQKSRQISVIFVSFPSCRLRTRARFSNSVKYLAARLAPQSPSHAAHLEGTPRSSPCPCGHDIQDAQPEARIVDQAWRVEIDPDLLGHRHRRTIAKLLWEEATRRVIIPDDPAGGRHGVGAVHAGDDVGPEAPRERVARRGGDGEARRGEGHWDAEVASLLGGGGGGRDDDGEVGEGDGDAAALGVDAEAEGRRVGAAVAGEGEGGVVDAGGGGLAGVEITKGDGGEFGRDVGVEGGSVGFGEGVRGGEGNTGGNEKGGEDGENGGGGKLHGG